MSVNNQTTGPSTIMSVCNGLLPFHHYLLHLRSPKGVNPMNRNDNLQAMANLNVAAYTAKNPEAVLRIRSAYYLHQVIEAILSENIASLPTYQGVN